MEEEDNDACTSGGSEHHSTFLGVVRLSELISLLIGRCVRKIENEKKKYLHTIL